MEKFYIHEDQENLQTNNHKRKKEIVKKKFFAENRHALQVLNQQQVQLVTEPISKQPREIKSPPQVDRLEKLQTPVKQSVPTSVPKSRLKSLLPIEEIDIEYESDTWEYLKYLERTSHQIRPSYMAKQPHVNWNMRSVLIDWLVDVCDEYKMSNQTLHLGINYLDRFLGNISVIREKFQLVGAVAMYIAGKVEEIFPPDAKEWTYLSGDAFSVRQVLKMEQLVLKVLEFKVHTPTILDFIHRICAKHGIDSKTMNLAMYLSELVLLEGREYLKHIPSKLASASLLLARHTLFQPEPWNQKLEASTGYTLKTLSPIVLKQQRTFKSSPFKEQKAILAKYKSDKYENVATVKPRVLVFDDNVDDEE